jgi:hypothetical protein
MIYLVSYWFISMVLFTSNLILVMFHEIFYSQLDETKLREKAPLSLYFQFLLRFHILFYLFIYFYGNLSKIKCKEVREGREEHFLFPVQETGRNILWYRLLEAV